MQSTEGERKTKVLIEPDKPEINRPDPNQSPKPLELPQRVHVRAPGIRTELATVERSVDSSTNMCRENWLLFHDGRLRGPCWERR